MRRIWAVVLCSVMAFAAGDALAKKKKKRKKKGGGGSGEMMKSGSRPYGMAGCGLGSIVMGADGNQILAVTTNATFYSQLFGITTGTSNCVEDGAAAAALRQEVFITSNLSTLMKEMSQGDGETLQAFSETLGCNGAVYPQVVSQLQANYNDIFKAPGALAVLDTAKRKLSEKPEIAGACGYLVI